MAWPADSDVDAPIRQNQIRMPPQAAVRDATIGR
jgi:hypothetical protein